MVTEPFPNDSRTDIRRAIEIAVHVGLLILLTIACLLILRPFLPLIAWGIIIAISSYPAYRRVRSLLGGRGTLAAVLCTVIFLGILIVPVALLTKTLIGGVQTLTAHIKEGSLTVPPPPASVESWPVIGAPLARTWNMASTNLTGLLKSVAPQLREMIPGLLHTTAGVGLTVLQFILSILVAGVLLANTSGGVAVAHLLAARLFGDRGLEFQELAGSTIRSVTNGIIGVAVIQAAVAGIGFILFGLPGAGLWSLAFLFGCVVQVGGIVLLPAIIYMFAIASTAKAIGFVVFCVVVVLMEHVLKPLLLGRGVPVPIVVVFLGAIGGFLAMGIVGLFVGAVILTVGHKLLIAWLEGSEAAKQNP